MISWFNLNRSLRRISGTALLAFFMIGCAASDGSRIREAFPTGAPGSLSAFNPFIASDPGGRVYVSFYGQVGKEQPGLYVTRSWDGGRTWLPEPVNIETVQPLGRRIGFHRLESDGRGNVYLMWSIESTSGRNIWRTVEVKRRHSQDYGATWSKIPIVWTPGRVINYPTARTGKDGELQIVYVIENKPNAGLFFTRTIQGGTAWLPSPIRIDHPQPEPSDQESGLAPKPQPPAWPAVIHNAAGHILVAWQEKRGPSEAIYFNRSLDQGATWSQEDIRLDHSTKKSSVSRMPILSTDSQGTIYVAWQDSRLRGWSIFFNRSLDQGATWLTQDVQINMTRPERSNAWNPHISSDSQGRIYVLWLEAVRDDSVSLFFTRSLDRGTTWAFQPRALVSRGKGTKLGVTSLASNAGGHVYLVWGDYADQKEAVSFSRSSDQGETWQSPLPSLNSEAAGYGIRWPRMSADENGGIYVVWTGNRSGEVSLFMNRSTDHGATWLAQEVQVTR